MKKAIIMLIGIAMGATAANAQATHSGKLQFKTETYDFGEVPEGPAAAYDFAFTNTGKEPVLISKAIAGCGCTTPTWPAQPIAPGNKENIHVSFNTIGRVGPFTKDVTVFSDATQAQVILHIKGTVKAKASGIAASVPLSSSVVK